MPRKRKIINTTAKALSKPRRFISEQKGKAADRNREAVKLARETRGKRANPQTLGGRRILDARFRVAGLKKKVIKRRRT